MSGTVGANVLGTSITPTLAVAGVSSSGLALTGLATGWMIHLAFYLLTLGLSAIATASVCGLRRRHHVIDRSGATVPEPTGARIRAGARGR